MAPTSSVLAEQSSKQINSVEKTTVVVDQQQEVVEQQTELSSGPEVVQLKQLVFFDLETGGLFNHSDILQIAAVDCYGADFNVYCRPTQPISKTASRINELTYKNDVMYYRKKAVPSEEIRDALIQFASYLESRPVDRVVMIAHNAAFDKRFLTHHIAKHGLESLFYPKLMGYADSVKYMKRHTPGLGSYKLGALTHSYLPKTAAAELHNAVTDVINLKLLFRRLVLKPMVGESKMADPEMKLADLDYNPIDLHGNTIQIKKSKKTSTKKAIKKTVTCEEEVTLDENNVKHKHKKIEYTESVEVEVVELEPPIGRRRLTRACKNTYHQVIEIDEDVPPTRKRQKEVANKSESNYTRVKSKRVRN